MKPNNSLISLSILVFTVSFLVFTWYDGCSSFDFSNPEVANPAESGFTKATFSNPMRIDNTFLPMAPETVNVYTTETEDGVETHIVEVLKETRVVAGIPCAVVRDRIFLDDFLIKDTFDWYAQDDDGHIWYMGETVSNYTYDDEGNPIDTNNDGSWEAGKDVAGVGSIAEPGIIIPAVPVVQDSYWQVYYKGSAEYMAKVVGKNVKVTLKDGTVYTGCVKILEWNSLVQDSGKHKYFAPGMGLIKEEVLNSEEHMEIKGIFLAGDPVFPNARSAIFAKPIIIDNTYLKFSSGVATYQVSGMEDEK